MRTCLLTSVFGVAFYAVFALVWSEATLAQEKKANDGIIQIFVYGEKDCPFVAVTVFREGKAIGSRDMLPNSNGGAGYVLDKLPDGSYEVHFQAPQHTTLIRKVVLGQERRASLSPTMVKGTGSMVLGGGPSLHDLEVRIRQLEEAVAKLKK